MRVRLIACILGPGVSVLMFTKKWPPFAQFDLTKHIGWRPAHTDFSEGLQSTIDWCLTHEPWWHPTKAATEARYAGRGR